MHFFALSNNYISGTLPSQIWTLSKLAFLGVERNNGFQGTIPTEIGLASSLKFLVLFETDISGTIPSELGLIDLQAFDVWDSSLKGTLPTELAKLTGLFSLLIHGTDLSGTFPQEFANHTSFYKLRMNDTMLTGEIPASLCSVPELVFDCPEMCGCDCPCSDGDDSGMFGSNATAEEGNDTV